MSEVSSFLLDKVARGGTSKSAVENLVAGKQSEEGSSSRLAHLRLHIPPEASVMV